jgi:transcriptional regulator with XRE-family HTH domain
MPMAAVGAYLRAVRIGRDIQQDTLAAQLDIAVRTIRNMETGSHPPRSDHLLLVAQAIGASVSHIARLMQPEASETLARCLASIQLSGRTLTDAELEQLEGMSNDQLRALIAFARQMQR